MLLIVIFVVGFLAGAIVAIGYFRHKHVGTLRVNHSDPTDGPYFFLEIDSGKAKMIEDQKYILLTVSHE